MTSRVPALIVHGGAGAGPQGGGGERRGWGAREAGGPPLDPVEAAVRVLEDHPRFNAGRGSVLTSAGTVEMDASIMEGNELRNGAVGSVTAIRHPISLARRILQSPLHSLFVGAGAVERARAFGIPP